ncbi:hypothetical protein BS50DRAFT_682196 [Corynespora cassiicola Philippines]|uniref:Uncharacterized protein n=1 Tax=Corynespora cassiicola Philippines TaxID=1448308 RepID=A0A2T2N2D3_CORCC|nr:hypothetical protein BS50DRAFT_682196 [Corynespora cassiicola Philippines]
MAKMWAWSCQFGLQCLLTNAAQVHTLFLMIALYWPAQAQGSPQLSPSLGISPPPSTTLPPRNIIMPVLTTRASPLGPTPPLGPPPYRRQIPVIEWPGTDIPLPVAGKPSQTVIVIYQTPHLTITTVLPTAFASQSLPPPNTLSTVIRTSSASAPNAPTPSGTSRLSSSTTITPRTTSYTTPPISTTMPPPPWSWHPDGPTPTSTPYPTGAHHVPDFDHTTLGILIGCSIPMLLVLLVFAWTKFVPEHKKDVVARFFRPVANAWARVLAAFASI